MAEQISESVQGSHDQQQTVGPLRSVRPQLLFEVDRVGDGLRLKVWI